MTADGNATILYQFGEGDTPQGGITEASDGRFYGVTTSSNSGAGFGAVYSSRCRPQRLPASRRRHRRVR